MPEIKLKPCPFCDGTDIRLSIKRAKYPYWCLAMYCNSCHCYGARTRVAIEKKGYISEREIKASTNAESMAVDTWNRRIEKMKPCKKCAHEKICRYCGIETSGCPHYLAAENNWIPFGFDEDGMLTGRLPEEDEEILVINKYGYIHKDKWCVDANGEYYLDSGWILVDYATAWMPLPEPYKPEE